MFVFGRPLFEADAGNGGNGGGAPGTPAPGAPVTPPAAPAAPAAPPAAPPAPPSVTDSFNQKGFGEFDADPDFANFKTPSDAFKELKTLKGLQKAREQNGLVEMIGENSAPEQVQAFWEKLGKPKASVEYDLKPPENMPQGLAYSDEATAEFAQFAFDNNFTKAQAQAGFELWNSKMIQAFEQQENDKTDRLEKNLTELEQVWGGKVESEQFKAHHQNAMRAFNTVADPDIAARFKADPLLASNPLVLEVLARLGSKMEPDSVPAVHGQLPSGRFSDTVSSVDKAIKSFHEKGPDGKTKFATMMNPADPASKGLKEEWKSLWAKKRELESGND